MIVGKITSVKDFFIQLTQVHPNAKGPGSAYRIKSRIVEAGYLLAPGGF